MKKRLAIWGMQIFLFLAGFPLKAEPLKEDPNKEMKKSHVVKEKIN